MPSPAPQRGSGGPLVPSACTGSQQTPVAVYGLPAPLAGVFTKLFDLGYTDVIPVIPNNAQLAPSSSIDPTSRGKAPGRRNGNGEWAGFNWRARKTSREECGLWDSWGANVGLGSHRFPCADIDVYEADVAEIIAGIAIKHLGNTIICVGQSPKRALLFRSKSPLAGFKIHFTLPNDQSLPGGKTSHLLEFLTNQQKVIAGMHPGTGRPYAWIGPSIHETPARDLPLITQEQVDAFRSAVFTFLTGFGASVSSHTRDRREGDRRRVDQVDLLAADRLMLANIIAEMPNRVGYDEMIKMLVAVKAAFADDPQSGWLAFRGWAMRWVIDVADPDMLESKWESFQPPFEIGERHIIGEALRWGVDVTEYTQASAIEDFAPFYDTPRDDRKADVADASISNPEDVSKATAVTAADAFLPVPEKHLPFVDFWDALRPPPFDTRRLPAVIRNFVEDRSRVIGGDPCALAWAAISACSAAVDGRIRLRMKIHDTWSVPPPIWVALIGSSSTRKTPIIDAAWQPLQRSQANELKTYVHRRKQWDSLSKEEKKSRAEPKALRLFTNDSTMEAAQGILTNQDRGIAGLHDELAGFISGMDKYTNKGGSERAFFLTAFNGGSHVVDRVGRGTVSVQNLLMTICGGIQPAKLSDLRDITDDGLWQRFVPIIVTPAKFGFDEPRSDAVSQYNRMVEWLLALQPSTAIRLSDEGHLVREAMERRVFDMQRSDAIGASFTSFCGKLAGLFGRLALVLTCISAGPSHPGDDFDDELSNAGDLIVSGEIAEMARDLIFSSVLPNAARIYTTMGTVDGGNAEVSKAIAGYILTKRKARLTASDLSSNVRSCRGSTLAQIQLMVSPLVAGGWLTPASDYPGNNVWLVNNAVHLIFAERAETERQRRDQVRALLVEHAA